MHTAKCFFLSAFSGEGMSFPLTFAKGKLSLVESVNLPILAVYKKDSAGACVYLYTLNLHTYTNSVMSVHTHFLAGTNGLVM